MQVCSFFDGQPRERSQGRCEGTRLPVAQFRAPGPTLPPLPEDRTVDEGAANLGTGAGAGAATAGAAGAKGAAAFGTR